MNQTNRHTDRYHRWDLLSCALKGHETYKPTGSREANAFAQQLHAETGQGQAWR